MAKNKLLTVEIIYALPSEQYLVALQVAEGTTAEQAVLQSGILTCYPEIDLAQQKVGIFSRLVDLSVLLNDGDRIEIYRPLTIDPKEARRLRALKKQQKT